VEPLIRDMTELVINDLANASGGAPTIKVPFEYLNYEYDSDQTEKAGWGDYSDDYGLKNAKNKIRTNENIIKYLNYYIKNGQLNFEELEEIEKKYNKEYVENKLKSKKTAPKK